MKRTDIYLPTQIFTRGQNHGQISKVGIQEAMKILSGSSKHQGKDGFFFNNMVYPEIIEIIIMTVTSELPSYPVRRVDIFASIISF